MRTIHEVVRALQTDQPNRRNRIPIYKGIASLIWMQYQVENDIQRSPFEHAPETFKRSILEVAEALANIVLEPDRRDAALMCMADAVCCGNYGGALTIHSVAPKAKQQYLTTAEAALQSFLLNMLNIPPDANYRNDMCRMIDALAPKTGVM